MLLPLGEVGRGLFYFMIQSKPIDWKMLIQIALTILTAIASAVGVTSCAMRFI